jgi:hypothetical protein
MKVWPIDPLVPRNLRLEVPEKLLQVTFPPRVLPLQCNILRVLAFLPLGDISSSHRVHRSRVGGFFMYKNF